MNKPDFLLLPRWLVPVVPAGQVLESWAVAVTGQSISGLLPAAEAAARWPDVEQVRLDDHVLLPGLINMHSHAAMTLFRGFADDLRLDDWLNNHIWPAEGRFVDRDFVLDGSRLAMVEMLHSGTTCFNDMYFFPDVTASVTSDTGLRATIGLPVIDIPTRWAAGSDEYFSRGLAVLEQWRGDDQVRIAFAPHAPFSVSDQQLQRIRSLVEEQDLPVHMHCLETAWEIEYSNQHHNLSPLERLARLDFLSPRLLAVHMTQLTDGDRDLLSSHGVHVIHCPESNLKLASGFCEVNKLQQAGINVAIGTDSAASNNNLDLLGEARTAALLAKGVSGDARALNAMQAIEMITINGARALGRSEQIGSIELGKQADFCAIDLAHANSQPVHNVISQIVYACGPQQVTDVWVGGRRLLHNKTITSLDEAEVLDRAGHWQQRLQQSDLSGQTAAGRA